MSAMQSLCDRVMWLDNGMVVEAGQTGPVSVDYIQRDAKPRLERAWEDRATAPGDDTVRLHSLSVTAIGQEPEEPITVKTAIRFDAAFWNDVPDADLNFSVVLYCLEGIPIFNTGSGGHRFPRGLVHGSFVIPGDFLNDGTYTVRLLIIKDASMALLDLNDLLVFEVLDSKREGNWDGKWVGAVRPRFDWQVSTDR
jgi:lipopolysaccharide transport system ATP-binding protein